MSTNVIPRFPSQIWLQIFSYLDKDSRNFAALTCQNWRHLIRNDPHLSAHLFIDLDKSNFMEWKGQTWSWKYEELNNQVLETFSSVQSLKFKSKHWDKNPLNWRFPHLFDLDQCILLQEVTFTSTKSMSFPDQLPQWIRAKEVSFNPKFKKGLIKARDVTKLIINVSKIKGEERDVQYLLGMKSIGKRLNCLKGVEIYFKDDIDWDFRNEELDLTPADVVMEGIRAFFNVKKSFCHTFEEFTVGILNSADDGTCIVRRSLKKIAEKCPNLKKVAIEGRLDCNVEFFGEHRLIWPKLQFLEVLKVNRIHFGGFTNRIWCYLNIKELHFDLTMISALDLIFFAEKCPKLEKFWLRNLKTHFSFCIHDYENLETLLSSFKSQVLKQIHIELDFSEEFEFLNKKETKALNHKIRNGIVQVLKNECFFAPQVDILIRNMYDLGKHFITKPYQKYVKVEEIESVENDEDSDENDEIKKEIKDDSDKDDFFSDEGDIDEDPDPYVPYDPDDSDSDRSEKWIFGDGWYERIGFEERFYY